MWGRKKTAAISAHNLSENLNAGNVYRAKAILLIIDSLAGDDGPAGATHRNGKEGNDYVGGDEGEGDEGGVYSFVACLGHLNIDHASLSRRGTKAEVGGGGASSLSCLP